MKRRRLNLIFVCMFSTAILITGCENSVVPISVRKDLVSIKKVHVGDSVNAMFEFRNNTFERQIVTFLPECDCTSLSAENMILEPRESGILKVRVGISAPGIFNKHIFVQIENSNEFFTVAVNGCAKR